MYKYAGAVHKKTLILGDALDTPSMLQVKELIKLSDGIIFDSVVNLNNIVPTMYCESLDDLTTIMLSDCHNLLSLVALQHLPFSPATNPGYPGRLVAGDRFLGRLAARDMSSGKARRGYVPGRLTRATSWDPHSFSQTNICHGGSFSRATCRLGY
ncbi:hypothetical protein Tco_1530286 [Tanacetum coccineum]